MLKDARAGEEGGRKKASEHLHITTFSFFKSTLLHCRIGRIEKFGRGVSIKRDIDCQTVMQPW